MSVQAILGDWARITKEKAIIIDTMTRILTIRSPVPAHKDKPDDSDPSDKSNPETHKKLHFDLITHNQTQQKLFDVLTNLRNQLWKLTQRKRDLVMKRRLMIENGKNLAMELEQIEKQRILGNTKLSNKQNMERNLNKDQFKQYLKLLSADYKQKCKELEKLREESERIEGRIQEGAEQEQIGQDQIERLKEQHDGLRESNREKRDEIKQMKLKLEEVERQISVNEGIRSKRMEQTITKHNLSNEQMSLKQLLTKIQKMEAVNKVLVDNHQKWIQAEQLYTQKINKHAQAIQRIHRKQNCQ